MDPQCEILQIVRHTATYTILEQLQSAPYGTARFSQGFRMGLKECIK